MEIILTTVIAIISGAYAIYRMYKKDQNEKEERISDLEIRVSIVESKVTQVELDVTEIKEIRKDISIIQRDLAVVVTMLHERTNKGS